MKFLKRLSVLFFAVGLAQSAAVHAQEYKVGAHVGAVGGENESKIGFGVNFLAIPSGVAGLNLDVTFAPFTAGTYYNINPSLVLFPADLGELKLGLMAGVGFHKFSGASMKFGLHAGALGEFNLTDQMGVGIITRYHKIFSDDWTYDVLLTFGFKFEGAGGW